MTTAQQTAQELRTQAAGFAAQAIEHRNSGRDTALRAVTVSDLEALAALLQRAATALDPQP